MGSFNLKCTISNKTIKYGDKVAVIQLSENDYRGNLEDSILIYHDDKYQLNTLPVFGTYNDYGGIEDIEDSHGLRDILSHYEVEYDEGIVSNSETISHVKLMEKDEKVSKLLENSPLMHIKREVYDYLMSDDFKELMVEEEYGSNLEYYKEEDLGENKEGIRKVYDKWVEYDKNSKGIEDENSFGLRMLGLDFSRMDESAYRVFQPEGIEVPQSLKIFTRSRYFIEFREYNNGNFEEYFDKLVKLDRLNNVFKTLGVRLIPTLYGNQGNVPDRLWDRVYENIPKTPEYDEDYVDYE